ncbi:MAG: Uncharacterized protein G01um101425_192 [Candidatus Peregrinibacteria bacterium Gr01-1014_25]|nr:MAG: Uncharacterized protein G01um101425_192 [Candidatus Peregrinibacteria bacterium Gr01-1014_25]
MEVMLQSGSTKAPKGTLLRTHEFTDPRGEHSCLVLELVGKSDDLATVEQECINVVRQGIVDADGAAEARLDGVLKELNGLLKAFIVAGAVEDAHMLVAILTADGQLHVSHAGRAEAYLIRRGTASQITEYTPGKPSPTFVHISSGTLEPRDAVVFCTQRLLRALTPAQLAQHIARDDRAVDGVVRALDGEGEHAAIAVLRTEGVQVTMPMRAARPTRRSREQGLRALLAPVLSAIENVVRSAAGALAHPRWFGTAREAAGTFVADLSHPQRRRRAHLFLLAGSLSALLLVWTTVHVFTLSQRSKTQAELEKLVGQISDQIQAADSRRLIGDVVAANEILSQAEEQAKTVMDSENGTFRTEALDLLDSIRAKYAEVNNIIRVTSPTVLVNVASRSADIVARGLVSVGDGEFTIFDRQDTYRVLQNSVDTPVRLSDEELIVDGAAFPQSRLASQVFLLTGNDVVEVIDGQRKQMKTEDPAGWMTGQDVEAYLKNIYVLSAEKKQIFKYERLTDRYTAPLPYNVSGDLTDALDMTIDVNIYVLKQGGSVVKLFRGEAQPFVISRAPEHVLDSVTKIAKAPGGNLYFLDPTHKRIIVVSENGDTGDAAYVRQYVLEGEQVGNLVDLSVDGEGTRLYVLDEKRLYVIDLVTR